MNYNEEQATVILRVLEDQMGKDEPAALKLKKIWWLLGRMRSRYLANIARNMGGGQVLAGPFKGLKLTQDAIAGYNACLVLGSYEHELHPVFEKTIAGNYTRILNIGCSVGYYAVGLARRMPHMIIDAFDTDPEARRKCAEMAELNNVQDRVRISGEFRAEDFAAYAAEKTLAIVDIEGGEESLLNPSAYPALEKIDIIVELHDILIQGISQKIINRFRPSHHTEFIMNSAILPDLSALIPADQYIDPFDHLLLGWEGRDGPTPWGIFVAKL